MHFYTILNTHRHKGFDIHLITQHPSLISPHVRKLVGKHIHIHRPYGGNRLKKFVYELCIDDPQRIGNWSLAQIFRFKLDKKYFGVYKSATQHTHKYKMPKHYTILALLMAVLIACIIVTYKSMSSMTNDNENKTEALNTLQQQPDPLKQTASLLNGNGNFNKTAPRTTEEYIQDLKPRIKDVPGSAPRYDEINRPVIMPKPTCLMSEDKNAINNAKRRRLQTGRYEDKQIVCQCYTQQGTKLDISINACVSYVENGYFDDTQGNHLNLNNIMQSDKRSATATGVRGASRHTTNNNNNKPAYLPTSPTK